MTFRQVRGFLDYWEQSPPENETLATLAQAFTTWRPGGNRPMTHEEHMASLEWRWKTGQAMSPKQMVESFGAGGRVSIGYDGVFRDANGNQIQGSHKFPGMQ